MRAQEVRLRAKVIGCPANQVTNYPSTVLEKNMRTPPSSVIFFTQLGNIFTQLALAKKLGKIYSGRLGFDSGGRPGSKT